MLRSFKTELPDEYDSWPPGDASPWEAGDAEDIVSAIKEMFSSAEEVESLAEENDTTVRVASYDDLSDSAKAYFDNMTPDSIRDFSPDTLKSITKMLGGVPPGDDADEEEENNAEEEAVGAIYSSLNSFKKRMPEEFNAWPEREAFVNAWEANDISTVADLFKNWHNYANDIYGQADEAGMDVDVTMFEDLSEDAQMFLDDFDISDPTSYDFDGLNEIYELLRDDAAAAPKSRAPALDLGDDEDEDGGVSSDADSDPFADLKVDELTPDEEPNMFDGKIDVSDIDPTDDDFDAELDKMLSGGKSKPTSAPKVDDDLSLEDLGDDLSLEDLGDDDLSLESLEPSGAKPSGAKPGVDDDLSLEDLGDDFGDDEEVGSSPLTSNDVVEYAAAIRAAKPGASRWSDIPNDHNAIYRFLNAVSDGDKAAHARVLLANRPDLKVTISSVMEDEFYEPNWEDENADDPFAGDDSNPLDNIFGGGDSGDIGADDDDLGYLLADAPKSGKTGAKVMDYNTALNTLGLDSAPFSDEDVQNAHFLLADLDSPAYPALEAKSFNGQILSQNLAAVMADNIVNGSSVDLGPVGAIKDTVKRAGAGGKQALEALLVEALGGAGEMYSL
jgi:hypothetical protein